MSIPKIGVTSSLGGGRYMWWFYWLSLRILGERPIRLVPQTEYDVSQLDGLIVGGGDDIGVELYGGEATLDTRIDPARDRLELHALEVAFEKNMPVLGICRGSQMLNVVYGGSLHEDVYDVYDGLQRRWTPLPVKSIDIEPESKLYDILKLHRLKVNSLHKQSVDKLGSGLTITASDEHGVVQAIEDPGARFRLGVQWHPEFMIYRSSQRNLFASFVAAVDEKFANDQ